MNAISNTTTAINPEKDLVLTRIMDVPREKLFKCWTSPDLMKQWFAPKPYTVPHVEVDLRAGGSSLLIMKSPEGDEIRCPGIYLEVIPNEKLVFTDAYTAAWEPSAKPFMTAIVTFEDIGNGQTKYTAIARHWTVDDRIAHEKMGFHEGWGICAGQLEALAKTL